MLELWNKFAEWYRSLNLDVILEWLMVVAIPTIIAVLKRKETKSLVREVNVVAKNKKDSESVSKLSTEVKNLKEDNNKSTEEIKEELKKLTAFMFIILKNAKISDKDKATIIQTYNSKNVESIKEIVNTPEDILENIVVEVEEEIKKSEPKPSKIDELVNSLTSK